MIAQVLLWVGVAAELLCCVGVWWMRDVFDRLHYAAGATSVGPVLIGVSASISGAGSSSSTVQVVAAAAVLLIVSPLFVHATARAARRLRFDDVSARPEDPEEAS